MLVKRKKEKNTCGVHYMDLRQVKTSTRNGKKLTGAKTLNIQDLWITGEQEEADVMVRNDEEPPSNSAG